MASGHRGIEGQGAWRSTAGHAENPQPSLTSKAASLSVPLRAVTAELNEQGKEIHGLVVDWFSLRSPAENEEVINGCTTQGDSDK